MKKWVIFEDKIYEIDTSKKSISKVDLGNGLMLVFLEGKPTIVKVKTYGEDVEVETPRIHARVKVKKSLPSDFSQLQTSTVQQIKSPMPALVVEVNKSPGDKVKKGETIVVIEAMKMRTQLKAKTDGVVKHVYVSPGVNVSKGQILAVIERE